MPEEAKDYFAKTLEKGIRILNLFDDNNPSWSLKEIAQRMEFNLTTTYRLVNTFVEMGYLKKGPQSKRLRLGPMSVALANRLLHGFDTNSLIKPLVDEIHEKHNISIDVSLYHSFRMVQVYQKEATNTLTYRQDVVSEQLYCTASGKSVMSYLPQAELEKLVQQHPFNQHTENTITDIAVFRSELERIRREGFASNNEEYIKGLIAIAAPLVGPVSHQPLGAVSFTSSTLDHTLTELKETYARILCDLADRISNVIPDI